MSGQYERQIDRENEKAVADAIAETYGMSARKMKSSYQIDYAFSSLNEVRAVTQISNDAVKDLTMVEIKCRNSTYRELDVIHGGLILSCDKWTSLLNWHRNYGTAIAVAAGLLDGVYLYSVKANEEPHRFEKLRMSGRSDRADSRDIEPCIVIPMNKFIKVCDVKTVSTRGA